MPNPKFDQKIQERFFNTQSDQVSHPTHGIILSYDNTTNTATVAVSTKGSDQIGETLNNVPCPYYPGVQATAPEPGRPCVVIFKDQSMRFPYISHYLNTPQGFLNLDYQRYARCDNVTPRYMFNF